jgi:hypothetical protein
VKRGGSLSFLTIFTFAVPELLDLISEKIGFLPYIVSSPKKFDPVTMTLAFDL